VTDTAGYVAVDSTNQVIAVAFRGSESVRNYLTDLTFSWTDVDACDGCRGFAGLYEAWGEVRESITTAVNAAKKANPSYRVLIAGHSLGGGIASIAAVELRNKGLVVDMVCHYSLARKKES
jgi:predicted alpha/beta hydrolase